jgi:hypothetical protein
MHDKIHLPAAPPDHAVPFGALNYFYFPVSAPAAQGGTRFVFEQGPPS